MKAIIFCSGNIDDYTDLKDRNFNNILIICADGGLKHTEALGITPDAVIGDRDSYTKDLNIDAEVFVYPSKKDFTDTHLCVDYAIDKGCSEIELLGGFGGRHDHEYSHYCLMAYALKKGVKLKMTDKYNEVFMEDKPFVLKRGKRKYISFFPYGSDVESFSVKGLKYSAENIMLSCGLVQATSNEFESEDRAEISFKSGMVLVMLCDDKGD